MEEIFYITFTRIFLITVKWIKFFLFENIFSIFTLVPCRLALKKILKKLLFFKFYKPGSDKPMSLGWGTRPKRTMIPPANKVLDVKMIAYYFLFK
jgi:hypothetical protein